MEIPPEIQDMIDLEKLDELIKYLQKKSSESSMLDKFMAFALTLDFGKTVYDMRSVKKNLLVDQNKQSRKIAVMITGLNEKENAPGTIQSFKAAGFNQEDIFYVDDGSDDGTKQEIMRQRLIPEKNILQDANMGKPHAMYRGAKLISSLGRYDYLLAADAEVRIPENAIIPTNDIAKRGYDGASFNIVPEIEDEHKNSLFSQIFVYLQMIEYGASMIGRKSIAKRGNVNCASGALALYKIDLYLNLIKDHTKIFTGDDQEATLRALKDYGAKIVHIDIPVYTKAPSVITEPKTGGWWKQRSRRWWPGTFRNMLRVNQIIFSKEKKFDLQIRANMLWEELSVYMDIPKWTYLGYIAITNNWASLAPFYMIYVLLSTFKFYKLKAYEQKAEINSHRYRTGNLYLVFLYPFYSLLNSASRIKALHVYMQERFFKEDWKNEKTKLSSPMWIEKKKEWDLQQKMLRSLIIFFIAFLSNPTFSQKKKRDSLGKKEFGLEYRLDAIYDTGSSQTNFRQHFARIDYAKNYIEWKTNPLNIISAGRYQKINWSKNHVGVIRPEVSYRYAGSGWSIGSRYTHYWKHRIVPYVDITYHSSGRETIQDGNSVTVLSLGGFSQVSDTWRIGSNIILDTKDSEKYVAVINNNYQKKNFFIKNYIWIGGKSVKGISCQIGYKYFYLQTSFSKRIDFSERDRSSIGLGVKYSIIKN